jgi:CheY-like chemotaxis protein
MPDPFRALVVAQSETFRLLVAAALRDLASPAGRRAETAEAADGFEALARAARERFDIVVTDLDLPVLPGEELIRLLRSRPEQASLPVVAVAWGDPEEGLTRLSGSAALASAPFTAETLAQALARAGFEP